MTEKKCAFNAEKTADGVKYSCETCGMNEFDWYGSPYSRDFPTPVMLKLEHNCIKTKKDVTCTMASKSWEGLQSIRFNLPYYHDDPFIRNFLEIIRELKEV